MVENVVTVSVGRTQWRVAFPDDDRIGRAVRSGRPYEADLLEAISCLVRPGDVAVDVGANIGNHTLYLAIVCQMSVHSYEPNPAAVRYLEENIALNGLREQVCIRAAALSDLEGRGSVLEREDEPGLHTVRIAPDPLGPVAMCRLDDIEPRNEGRIALIKVDVEGGEPRVLKGAAEIIEEHRPVIVAEAETEARLRVIDETLAAFGYWRVPMVFAWTPTYMYLPSKTLVLRFLRRPAVLRRLGVQYARGLARRVAHHDENREIATHRCVGAGHGVLSAPARTADLRQRFAQLRGRCSRVAAHVGRARGRN